MIRSPVLAVTRGNSPTTGTGPTATARPTATATPRPTLRPTATPSTGGIIDTSFASIAVPSSWHSSNRQSSVVEVDPDSGPGQIFSGYLTDSAGSSNSDMPAKILALDQKNSSDARDCSPSQNTAQLSTDSTPIDAGIVDISETYNPSSGGSPFAAVDRFVVGVATLSDGSTVDVFINIFAPKSSFNAFAASIPDSLLTRTIFKATAP